MKVMFLFQINVDAAVETPPSSAIEEPLLSPTGLQRMGEKLAAFGDDCIVYGEEVSSISQFPELK